MDVPIDKAAVQARSTFLDQAIAMYATSSPQLSAHLAVEQAESSQELLGDSRR